MFCYRGWVFAASNSDVWLLHSVNFSEQISQFLAQKQFELALRMAVSRFFFMFSLYIFTNMFLSFFHHFQYIFSGDDTGVGRGEKSIDKTYRKFERFLSLLQTKF